MAETDFVSQVPACKVHVDGAPLNGSAGARLTRVGVRLDADLFGQCNLTFDDPDLAIMNGDTFQSGRRSR
jgi:uracil-DNA glycosylase